MKKIVVVIICLLALCGCSKEADNPKKITCDEKDKIINESVSSSNKTMLIDVRTKEEFDEKHLEGAINIPYEKIVEGLVDYGNVDFETSIIVYCRSGNRSNTAAKDLVKAGYENVYDLGAISNCNK